MTPLQPGQKADVMEMEMSDAMPDPFPENEHAGAEVVIYSNMQLLNCDNNQFKYFFVNYVCTKTNEILTSCSPDGIYDETLLLQALASSEGLDKCYYQIAYYYSRNKNTKYVFGNEKLTWLQYYTRQGVAWKAIYLYVMIFLLKQQQWSNNVYELFKNSIHEIWIQNESSQNLATLADFEGLLIEADKQSGIITEKERKSQESNSKKRGIDEVDDRTTMTVVQLIQENPQFSNFAVNAEGVQNLAEYFANAYAKINTEVSQEWFGILNKKSKTQTLFSGVLPFFERSTCRFRLLYPTKSTQMAYWIMYYIKSSQSPDSWVELLNKAEKATTGSRQGMARRTDEPRFANRLTADFDCCESDDIANNGIHTLSTRIDRLLDW